MSTVPCAGQEVDAYCTKCRLDLNHRIIAMDGDRIKRVECLTCRGHHNYRRPKSAAAPPRKRASAKRTTKAAASRAAAAAASSLKIRWVEAMADQQPEAFSAYHMNGLFSAGQLLHHTKFGNGLVEHVIEGGKVRVLFEAGLKTLVHGR